MSESMDFARFRPRTAVLLTLGVLALAALLAGGCAAPDDDERARFAVVTGVVLDQNNNPVAGAVVSVVPALEAPVAGGPLGTRNFFGNPGPFVTGPDGRFFIPGVKVAQTASEVVVLNLQATAPGFLPSFVVAPAPQTTTILGRPFVEGVETRDIVITQDVVSSLVARLVPPGQTASVGSGGIQNLTVPVVDAATGGTTGTATVNIPAGAIAGGQPVQLAVTGVTGTSLASVAAPAPSQVPTVGSPAAPAANAALGSGVVPATLPVAGIDIRALNAPVSFTGPKPTVTVPVPAGLIVTGLSSRQIPVDALAVVFFNEARGAWELIPGAIVNVTSTQVTFAIGESTGTYALVIPATWTLPAPAQTGENVLFPPIAGFNGYVSVGRISQSLDFPTVSEPMEALLLGAYAALTGEVPNGPFVVQVPPGTETGRSADQVAATVSVSFGTLGTIQGTRTTWQVEDVAVPQAPEIPSHLQGHVQGGGVGG
ncbi:MAG TPA: carboxypeptidase regulatory-like domain-containing protein [Armatimonadetes bacterium]|jgi:hypothetical protein|nr:carboxypeptidase regulatory-like domain-containing protein [Armatimonadota bacterium]